MTKKKEEANPVKEFKDNMQELVNKSNDIDSISISTEIDGEKKEIVLATKEEKTEPENPVEVIHPDEKRNFTSKLHLACLDDELCPTMECIHFKNGYAYATNGVLLIKQSLDYHKIISPEKLEGKSIHKDSFKQILSFRIAEAKEESITCSDGWREVEFLYAKNGIPPDFEKVIPLDEPIKREWCGLNTEQVNIAGQILHGSKIGCKFTFKGKSSVILTTTDYQYQLALIALVALEQSLF